MIARALIGAFVATALLFSGPVAALPTSWVPDPSPPDIWPGWAAKYPSTDVWGAPDITEWGVAIQGIGANRTITEIAFKYNLGSLDASNILWEVMEPGDLFIDLRPANNTQLATYQWDYVVVPDRPADDGTIAGNRSTATSYGATVYSVSNLESDGTTPGISGSYYVTGAAGDPDPYGPYGSTIRDGHPWAVDPSALGQATNPNAQFDWQREDLNQGGGTYAYMVFSGLNIAAPDDGSGDYDSIGIGFTINCANDVVYDGRTVPQEDIPEPTTLLLLGSGLLGLVGVRRRTL